MIARLLELRSEYFPVVFTIDSIGTPRPKRYTNPPFGKRLEKYALITSEVNAILGAQLTQVCQPILLGDIPSEWKPVIELQKEVYEAGLELLKPGTMLGTLCDFVNGFGEKRKMKTLIQMHGCGYGDDGPLLSPRFHGDYLRDLRIEEDNAFVWKPIAMTADGRIQFAWGGPVLVTEEGGEELFKRQHGMVSIT